MNSNYEKLMEDTIVYQLPDLNMRVMESDKEAADEATNRHAFG